MIWRRWAVPVVLLGTSVFGLFSVGPAMAEDVSVTATVVEVGSTQPANPIVEFKGTAAPNATMYVKRSGVTITTLAASGSASFDILLSEQPIGQQVYEVGATDSDGRSLPPMTFALNLTAGSTTIIIGIFFGPSIVADKTSVKLGQFIGLSGSTAPNSSVTVTVNSLLALNYSVSADTNGRWSKLINTQETGVGSHTAKAQTSMTGTGVSEYSASVSFAVNPLEQCDGKKTADLNCDGRVNLTDFSILLFFWQERNPANSRSDVNGDSQVTITDFSIMLFQWAV